MIPKLKPDPDDPLKIRRVLAIWCALYALIVWPNLLVLYAVRFQLGQDLVRDLLVYIGTLAAGPIGAYLWASFKQQRGDKMEGD